MDSDLDGISDCLDVDDDNDGIIDSIEALGFNNSNQPIDTSLNGRSDLTRGGGPDSDRDGLPNHLDIDSDGDGIPDSIEAQGKRNPILPSGIDANHNGLDDSFDPQTGGVLIIPVDTDGNGIPDYLQADSDDDFVPDFIEGNDANHDGRADIAASGIDSDSDGLDDSFDTLARGATLNAFTSRVILQDTDGDGLPDYRDRDDDGDGTLTSVEDTNRDGDPTNDDDNGNGIPDYLDSQSGSDSDGDGLSNTEERRLGTDPFDPDTDGDGIPDGAELGLIPFRGGIRNTDPLDSDSDDDGISDGSEVLIGTDPLNIDSDGDGLQDGTEIGINSGLPDRVTGSGIQIVGTDLQKFRPDLDPATRTDPLLSDSDGGGRSDGDEDANKNGRFDAKELLPTKASDDCVGSYVNQLCNQKSLQTKIDAITRAAKKVERLKKRIISFTDLVNSTLPRFEATGEERGVQCSKINPKPAITKIQNEFAIPKKLLARTTANRTTNSLIQSLTDFPSVKVCGANVAKYGRRH